MELSDADKKIVASALQALRSREPSLFEDRLWLGFGDEWGRVRRWLVQRQYVVDNGATWITTAGVRFLSRLDGQLNGDDGTDA